VGTMRMDETVRRTNKRKMGQGAGSKEKRAKPDTRAEGNSTGDSITRQYKGQSENCTTSVAALKTGIG
jgi:hypothetical protein